MNLSNLGKCIVQRCSILLVVLSVTVVASAGRSPQKSEPEHKSTPTKPALHSAPEHKSGPSKAASHPAPAHKSAPSKAASHPAPEHQSAPSRPASHVAPAHKSDPSKSASRPAPAEHTGGNAEEREPKAVGEHTAAAEHFSAGEHTAATERSAVRTREVSLKGGGTASIRSNGQIRSVDHDGMRIDHGVTAGVRW